MLAHSHVPSMTAMSGGRDLFTNIFLRNWKSCGFVKRILSDLTEISVLGALECRSLELRREYPIVHQMTAYHLMLGFFPPNCSPCERSYFLLRPIRN